MSLATRVRIYAKQATFGDLEVPAWFSELEVVRFSDDEFNAKSPRDKCGAADEVCRITHVLRSVKSGKKLVFLARRTAEGMRAFSHLIKEQQAEQLSDFEAHLREVFLFVPKGNDASMTDIGVKLLAARIDTCLIEDASNFRVKVWADKAKGVNI